MTDGGIGRSIINAAVAAGKTIIAFKNGDPIVADNPTHERRLTLCRDCKHIQGNRCELCGCFTNLKARLETETCPINKW